MRCAPVELTTILRLRFLGGQWPHVDMNGCACEDPFVAVDETKISWAVRQHTHVKMTRHAERATSEE